MSTSENATWRETQINQIKWNKINKPYRMITQQRHRMEKYERKFYKNEQTITCDKRLKPA